MNALELIKRLCDCRPYEQVHIDAAGRGTFEIADIEQILQGSIILVTERELWDRESIHDKEELISHFTDSRTV